MKKNLLAILTLMFFTVSSIAANVVTIPKSPSVKIPKLAGKIIITSPHKGDYFVAGNTVKIRWKSIGHIPEKCVSINLFKGLSNVEELTNKVCVNGFNWKIPINFTDGQYKIRLITKDKKILADSAVFPIIASKPDLSVRKIYVTPRYPDMGDNVKIGIEIINNGGFKSSNFKAEVVIYKPDNKILYPKNTVNVKALTSLGGRKIVDIPVTLDRTQHGRYAVKVKLDTDNSVNEANENNNTKTYYFAAKALPNLVVCVDTDKRPRPLKKATIRAYVLNRGDVASKPCNLTIAVQDDYYPKIHKYSRSIPAIKPHGVYSAAHIRYRWANMDKSARRKYFYVFVDDKKQVKESSESDNLASGFYYLTRYGGKHGAKNKVSCSWFGPAPVDKSSVDIK